MKKVFMLLFVFIISTSMYITIHATDAQQLYNDNLQVILNDHLDENEYQKLSNKSKHNSSMHDVVLENKPIIKVYNEMYWHLSDWPIHDIIKRANSLNTIDYIVFGESPIRLRMLHADSNSDYTVGVQDSCVSSKPVSDIQKASKNMLILDTACTVTNIYFFDGFTSHMGASVYYITTDGNFVKYYKDELSEGVWFTEAEYSYFAMLYNNYLTSPENNYNEYGEPIGGGILSFLDFLTNMNDITPDEGEKNDGNPVTTTTTPAPVPQDEPNPLRYLVIPVAIVAVGGAVGLVWYRVRKKKE